MTICIGEITSHAAFNELDHTSTQGIPIDMARMMAAHMTITQDENGVFFQGKIFERIDDGYNVRDCPASEIELRVKGAHAMLTMKGLCAPGLFSQWILEQTGKPKLVHSPVPGPMHFCS